MATLTSPQAAATYPIVKPIGAGTVAAAIGTLNLTASPTNADVLQLVRVPAGVTVFAGTIFSAVIDSAGSKTFNGTVGWDANGDEAAAYGATGFGTLGVITATGYQFNLGGVLLPNGPKTFTRETVIGITQTASATTFAAGAISAVVLYRVN